MVRKSSSPTKRGGKSIAEKAIESLAQLYALGITVVTISRLMKMCNADKEGSFKILMGKKKKEGLISMPDKKTYSLTAVGVAAAPKISKPATQEELTMLIKSIFKVGDSGVPGKIYAILLDGNSHSVNDLATECGYDPADKKKMVSFKVMLR
ncbi:MAG: hypothetical protein SGARI_002462, partial [Bacillariaceae sp.]